MAQLPKITNPNPVAIAAVEAIEFNELFVTRFNVSGAQLTVEATLYNYDKNQQHPTASPQSYTFPNVYELAGEYPVVANSMGLLTYAVALLIPLLVAQKQLAAIGSDEERTEEMSDEEITAMKLRNRHRLIDRAAPQASIEVIESQLRGG